MNPYVGAYPFLDFRAGVWREIARYVARDAQKARVVIELGAGYCDFINQFPAEKKLAFDLNPEMRQHVHASVELRIEDATRLAGVADGSVDLIFASNFLEHLEGEELTRLLGNVRRVLRVGGRLMLIQPNYRLCADNYFDDPTHKTIFGDDNVASFLTPHDLRIVRMVPGFLPFSMKSRLPKWPILTRLYLNSPIKPLAAQMYVVAERSSSHLER